MGFQTFFFFFSSQIFCPCQKEQLGWRQTIPPHSLQRPRGKKPGYLDSLSAAKPLLKFLVHFWAEEDFEKECGRGEGSLEGTYQHKRGSRKKKMGV